MDKNTDKNTDRAKVKQSKLDYVRANLQLFTDAYSEFRVRIHRRHKFKSAINNYTKFVEQARKDFNYSEKTGSRDIFNQFVFTEIIMTIHYNEQKKRLKEPGIQRALGYVSPTARN